MEKVLVAGATGYLGRYVVEELKKQGYGVKALVRDENKIEDLKEKIEEVFVGEVTDPSSIKGVCEDIDCVISSVGITRQKDGLTYMDVDYQANRNLLDEALANGVKKFIFVSVLNAHLMKDLNVIQAKEKFVNELINTGMDYAVIRPTGFFSDMLEFLKMAKKGRVSLFGDGSNNINPIHGADLAEVCVRSIKDSEKEINIGGPEIFTYNQIAELAFKVLDKDPKISRTPPWLNNSVISMMRIFTSPKIYGPLEFMMSVMTMDVVGDVYGRERLEVFYKKNVKV